MNNEYIIHFPKLVILTIFKSTSCLFGKTNRREEYNEAECSSVINGIVNIIIRNRN